MCSRRTLEPWDNKFQIKADYIVIDLAPSRKDANLLGALASLRETYERWSGTLWSYR